MDGSSESGVTRRHIHRGSITTPNSVRLRLRFIGATNR